MKTLKKLIYLFACLLLVLQSCKESERYKPTSDDTMPPDPPSDVVGVPLNGGARIYYKIPAGANNQDLMSIEAECEGRKCAVSFYNDSLDMTGLAEERPYTIEVRALDQAGNRSTPQSVTVTPLESAISKVAKTIVVKGGFDALVVTWKNVLEQPVNVFVDYTFNEGGVERKLMKVFSTKDTSTLGFVSGLELPASEQVKVKVSVGDIYQNRTAVEDKGAFTMLQDKEIIHFDELGNNTWSYPQERTQPPFGGGVTQVWGNDFDGKTEKFIDGIIDNTPNDYNYIFANNYEGPYWNYLIDLGKDYELSRVILHGRHGGEIGTRGQWYDDDCGIFACYRWDEESAQWEMLGEYKTILPTTQLSDLQWYKLGIAGNMHYIYPEDPKFTKPTRWFRFEARHSFRENYTAGPPACLSELRLFCKPQ